MAPAAVGSARPYLRLVLVVASLAALLFSLAVATRPTLAQGPPGNNGTVKIHDTIGEEPSPVMRNEPHVGCQFHIHGFNFDPGQDGDWWILEWPPTGDGELAADDWYLADSNGEFEEPVDLTAYIAAHPSDHNQGNHFKLFVEGENGEPNDGILETTEVKHKVFWVECEAQPGVEATPTPTPAPVGAQVTPTPTPVQGVAGATGTPVPGLPITATGGLATSPIAPVVFGLILIASAAALAVTSLAGLRRRL
jgi:hypothetical protein